MINIVAMGFQELARLINRDRQKVKGEYLRKGVNDACLLVIAHTQKTYFRGESGQDPATGRLGRVTGDLAAKMTHKVQEGTLGGTTGLVGWWANPYAETVAEPMDGRTSTVIRPKHSNALWFPLTKDARNVWHLRHGAESFSDAGIYGLIMGGKRLVFGEDYTIAKSVRIEARFPASHALHDKLSTVEKVIMDAQRVLE